LKHKNIGESLITAFSGLFFALRHQKNSRYLAVIALVVTGVSPWLGLSIAEYMILALTISLVIITELINSGLEYAIDLVTDDYHELAKAAKDVAAAAVLVSCVNAVFVAVLFTISKVKGI
jgi:diacylglycerol kinase (ATP)